MLTNLSIRNLALIDQLTLQFNAGFSALTGETGAGKSILLDALGLVLGARADATLVRHGHDKADIQASFDLSNLPHLKTQLAEEELLDEDEPDTLILRRTVRANGGSSAWVNGIKVPAAALKTLGEQLIDIHGQHAHQQLMQPPYQRQLLDAYGQHETLLKKVAAAYKQWKTLKKQLREKQVAQHQREEQLALLEMQLQAMDALNPTREAYETLNQQHSMLAHAEALLNAAQTAAHALDGEQGAASALYTALQALERVRDIDTALAPHLEQLNTLLITTEELGRDLHHYADQINLDPAALAEVEAQLAEYHSLAKKHLCAPEALEALHAQLKQRHHELLHADEVLAELEAAVEQAWQTYQNEAETLHQRRLAAGAQLSEAVSKTAHPLGLPHLQFEVQLSPLATPDASGLDKVTFTMTTNPGHPLQPLNKVASGGELARISLALEVVLADVAGLPTLIFDEVDVGVGGAVAEQIGQLMRRLGNQRQVLAITHQPQVAACAHTHYKVEKHRQADSTTTQVTHLPPDAQVEELARMLGGSTLTEATYQHARELFNHGQVTDGHD